MDRILILGASGLAGNALLKELNKKYEVYGTYNTNKIASKSQIYFNMNEIYKIIEILKIVKPLKVLYCLRGSFNCQIELLRELVKYLKSNDGKLYFCSTANVFDGDTTSHHFKSEVPIAESDYGKFKIECEEILKKELGHNSIIFRLPMIWGKKSPRLNSLISAITNSEKVEVYKNLYLNNNTDVMLAKQIHYILENDLKGIFHLGSHEVINHYEFIKKIITNLGYKYTKFNEIVLPTEKYYLAALPTDGDLPKELSFSNEDVISYLTSEVGNI